MKGYKAAIIGCGRMSHGHAHAYREAGIPLVAVADISEEALDKYRENYGVEKRYTDYKKMLDEVKPDLVSIVTHDKLHCPMVVAAAERGTKGIVCEKPMAMNLAEADRMLLACSKSGSKLTISHQRYYMPQYARSRELIAEGAIGKVRSAEAYLSPRCLVTDGTHTIHMLLSLLGDPQITHLLAQVDGHSDYRYYGHRCEEAGTAFFYFENQVYAHMTWGFASRNPNVLLNPALKYYYHCFIIHGDEGKLELDGDFLVKPSEMQKPIVRIVRGAHQETIPIEWPSKKNPIALEVEDLVRSIETSATHPLDGQNGRRVLEAIMAIYESSRQRRVVQFPIDVTENPFLAMCDAGEFPA